MSKKNTKKQALSVVKGSENPQLYKETDPQQESLTRMGKQLERHKNLKFEEDKEKNTITVSEEDPALVRFQLFETTGQYNSDAGGHLIQQAYKSQPQSQASWNVTTALLHGIAPKDSLEGIIATQMVATHNMAMECARKAMFKDQHPEAIQRYIHLSAKLMSAFASQMDTLQKYRTKGQQQIVVKHQQVNVSEGGQAVVGDIHQGGGGVGNDSKKITMNPVSSEKRP
ncbi:MAG: hypothetical protein K2X01_11770 [Cyanobacteria bacterium]|nr:hypothetical protein [Cyanobacteriota bacterium]